MSYGRGLHWDGELHGFEEIMMRKGGPADLSMGRYSHDGPRMSLGCDSPEIPVQAFAKKMPPAGETVMDGQAGEECHAK